ncbi:MAG: hypothetical protein HYR96_02365 [Deltaproteobacteria bacterium]|nr:hypothetical protein [Deltaproteobacteria bacterium]MBI3293152.1 hypothetical protein [Deltaproteobacteria bacterium]
MTPQVLASPIPETLSRVYPLILVTSLLFSLFLLAIFFGFRALLRGVSRSQGGQEADAAPGTQESLKGRRGNGFWAQVFLYLEERKKVKGDGELERLTRECERLMKENADLRRLRANSLVRGEVSKDDQEAICARLRAAEVDLVKERAIRLRLEERCSKLEREQKKILAEVAQTYKANHQAVPLTAVASDEVTLLKAALSARDVEIERLKAQLRPKAA